MPYLCRRPGFVAVALAIVAAIALATFGGRPTSAAAHPLGNFTINHYDRVEVSETGIEVYRVLDMAEIPTFQERQRIDLNGDGDVDAAEAETWAAETAANLRERMTLTVNGDDIALADLYHEVTFPEGQGGLSLTRLTARYTAKLPGGWRDSPPRVEFRDDNYADRLGWREIIVRGAPGVDIAGSSVPEQDISGELLAYPQGSLSSPLDVRTATFSFQPGAGSAPSTRADSNEARATRGNPDGYLVRFTELVSRKDMSAGFVILALLAAMGFGAIHALSPGHGKTIVAAYLIGSRGTAKHALLLGLTVTATHTSSVYALGFITLYLSAYIVPETLYPWLSIISGGIILLMGLSLFIGRTRSSGAPGMIRRWLRGRGSGASRRGLASESGAVVMARTPAVRMDAAHAGDANPHGHDHADGDDQEHAHGHAHDDNAHKHGWGAAHSHAIPGQDGEPVTWQRLLGLGIFGGMVPCPSAIVVMLSAIALHRVVFGLMLILSFSLGLAIVLTAIGFALVYSKAILRRLPFLRRVADRADDGVGRVVVRAFPVLSAAAVVVAGLVITLRALSQQGWL